MKADLITVFEDKFTIYFPLDPVHPLIDHWLFQPHGFSGSTQHKIALRIDLGFLHALEAKRDDLGVCTRCNDKVEFQLILVAIVEDIHPGIDILIPNFGVHGNVGTPFFRVVANEVMTLAQKLIQPHDQRSRVRINEFHVQS